MAIYRNTNAASSITQVEFSPVAAGNFSFFTIDNPEHAAAVKQWLTSANVGQEIIAQTDVGGHAMLITQGDKSKKTLLQLLEAQGDRFELQVKDKKFNPWLWRGAMSMIGQPMQLVSSLIGVEKNADGPITGKDGVHYKYKDKDYATFGFAALNIAANFVNIFFGAEKQPSKHHMRILKREVNDRLDEHLSPGQTVFDVNDKRADLHKGPQQPKSIGEKIHDFIQRNSVMMGEIGLRYLGGISLVMPLLKKNPATGKQSMVHLKNGLVNIFKGEFKPAFETLINTDKKTRNAGTLWLAGKTIGFFSKVPDPYDPKSHTWVDTIREKVLFRASTLTEAAGATTIAVDRFKKRKIAIKGNVSRDYLGSVGGGLFIAAFGMRFFAPFGEKQLNMEEINAHVTDTLAKTPPEKIPQLMADVAATVKEHMKDKLGYGEIYTRMMTDLYRYHNIGINSFAGGTKASPAVAAAAVPQPTTPLPPRRALLDRVAMPATKHIEDARRSKETHQIGF